MKTNMGKADRYLRIVLAVAIAVLYFSGYISGVWAIVLLILATVFVVTSFIGFCPLYFPFGWSTRRKSTTKTA